MKKKLYKPVSVDDVNVTALMTQSTCRCCWSDFWSVRSWTVSILATVQLSVDREVKELCNSEGNVRYIQDQHFYKQNKTADTGKLVTLFPVINSTLMKPRWL